MIQVSVRVRSLMARCQVLAVAWQVAEGQGRGCSLGTCSSCSLCHSICGVREPAIDHAYCSYLCHFICLLKYWQVWIAKDVYAVLYVKRGNFYAYQNNLVFLLSGNPLHLHFETLLREDGLPRLLSRELRTLKISRFGKKQDPTNSTFPKLHSSLLHASGKLSKMEFELKLN